MPLFTCNDEMRFRHYCQRNRESIGSHTTIVRREWLEMWTFNMIECRTAQIMIDWEFNTIRLANWSGSGFARRNGSNEQRNEDQLVGSKVNL